MADFKRDPSVVVKGTARAHRVSPLTQLAASLPSVDQALEKFIARINHTDAAVPAALDAYDAPEATFVEHHDRAEDAALPRHGPDDQLHALAELRGRVEAAERRAYAAEELSNALSQALALRTSAGSSGSARDVRPSGGSAAGSPRDMRTSRDRRDAAEPRTSASAIPGTPRRTREPRDRRDTVGPRTTGGSVPGSLDVRTSGEAAAGSPRASRRPGSAGLADAAADALADGEAMRRALVAGRGASRPPSRHLRGLAVACSFLAGIAATFAMSRLMWNTAGSQPAATAAPGGPALPPPRPIVTPILPPVVTPIESPAAATPTPAATTPAAPPRPAAMHQTTDTAGSSSAAVEPRTTSAPSTPAVSPTPVAVPASAPAPAAPSPASAHVAAPHADGAAVPAAPERTASPPGKLADPVAKPATPNGPAAPQDRKTPTGSGTGSPSGPS